MDRHGDKNSERVLIFTPYGKDAQHLSKVLGAQGFGCVSCGSFTEVAKAMSGGVSAILTTEEALERKDMAVFVSELKNQPKWSAIPLLVFYTPRDSRDTFQRKLAEPITEIAEINYLQRPVSSLTLVSAVKSAIRDRNRQYQIRDLLTHMREDMDRTKKAEEQLREERDLRERFVATLSHDLRTPLTAAKLCTQILARGANNPETVQKMTVRIGDSIHRADQMIRDLLDANRLRAGEKLPVEIEDCDLREIAASTLEELSTIHGDRFVLQAPDRIEGRWSPSGVRRILENLCGNAIKYGAAHRPVTVSILPERETVRIEVHNEGPTIPESDLPNLFDPFRRTVSAQSSGQVGWGLGLTLVKGIAEAHEGSVRVESSEARGTRFVVTLPRFFGLVLLPQKRVSK